MININQTSEQTKILIPRSNINGDIEKNKYVTEDELQEILKDNSIPYIVVDGSSFSGFEITKGDWGAVHNAIQNNKPYLIYANSSNTGTIFSLVDDINPLPQGGASIATTLITANRKVTYRAWIIDINGNVELGVEETYTIQPKLVSGENIKTINGNDILGEGDIIIESGTEIPYLYVLQNGEMVGDFDAVYDAVANKKPYLLYVYSFNNSIFYNSLAESVETNGDKIECSDDVIINVDGEPKLFHKVLLIGKDGVTVLNSIEKILPTEFKTINGNEITGTGDIVIEGGNGNIVELTQSEYNGITPEPDTLYVISDAPAVEIPDTSEFITESELNSKGYTTSNSFKTINNQSIVGSGNITIEGGSGTEIMYLWKLNGTSNSSSYLQDNIQVRNTLLSLRTTEEYPVIVVKDYYNDTICNNVYVTSNYVEIQCCNSRIGGVANELIDERYELASDGRLIYVKNDVVATQNYVDEKISDINIESGGNIVELTQSEYNSITPEPDTLYLISDSNINTTLKTINGESIIGEGDIKIDVDLTGYATTAYVDEQIGDINSVLENIIG